MAQLGRGVQQQGASASGAGGAGHRAEAVGEQQRGVR
uniref:Uncharacterized protein n=1 Tax=Setaria italica TaxID=4555 RepID=K3YF95_SETIT